MSPWFAALGVSLALTLAAELGFALLCRVRGRALVLVALVNVLTNPLVVQAALLWRAFALPGYAAAVAVLELLAVWLEGFVYRKSRLGFAHPCGFSLAANALSFGLGLLLRLIF